MIVVLTRLSLFKASSRETHFFLPRGDDDDLALFPAC